MRYKKIIFFISIIFILILTTSSISSTSIIKNYTVGEGVDQNQERETGYKEIRSREWQEFVPSAKKHLRIEVKIRAVQGETNPIRLNIEKPLGTVLSSKELPASAIPNTAEWVSFDISDIKLNPGEKYNIVLSTSPAAYYFWYGSSNNPYPNGDSSIGPGWDWCFRTYVQNSKSKTMDNTDFTGSINWFLRLIFKENFKITDILFD